MGNAPRSSFRKAARVGGLWLLAASAFQAAPAPASTDLDASSVILDSLSDFRGSYVEPVELAVSQARWDDALALVRRALALPEALEHLYPVDGQEASSFYIPLERYLIDMVLAKAPEDVAERFRGEMDAAVRPALAEARAGDPRRLARLGGRLYASRLRGEAYALLGDLSWERGDAPQACAYWRLSAEGEGVARGLRERLALAAGFEPAGEGTPAGDLSVGGVTLPYGRWAGRFTGAAPDEARNAWHTFGGGLRGTRISPAIPAEAHLRLTGNPDLKSSSAGGRARGPGQKPPQGAGGGYSSFATVFSGRVYISEDGYNYSAYDVETGKLKGKSSVSVPAASVNKNYYGYGQQVAPFYCVTVCSDAVYAMAPVKTDPKGQQVFLPTAPLAHDPVTDKILKPFAYGPGQDPLEIVGSPLVWKRLLLCAGVDDKGSLYAVAFDRESGLESWRAFLCFQANSTPRFGHPAAQVQTPAFMAVEGETLFACTNRGAFVSVDLSTGRRRWAIRYPQPPVRNPQFRGGQPPTERYWDPNPVIVQDGQVVIAPMDTNRLLAYDGATGELLWEWKPNQGETDAERMMHVLGPVDGKLVLVGSRKGQLVEWLGGKRYGEIRMPPGGAAGRPAVADGCLYVAGRESNREGGIYRIDLATLKLVGCFLAWPEGSVAEGANLTLTESALVAVGDTACRVYTITPNPETAFREAIEKAPGDARSYRSLIRYLSDKGRFDEAVAALGEAVRRAPSPDNAWVSEGVGLCEAFLKQAGREGSKSLSFLDGAAAAVPGLGEEPAYLVGWARLEEELGRKEEAFGRYARLLEKSGAISTGDIEIHLPAYAARQMIRLGRDVSEKARVSAARQAAERLEKSTLPEGPEVDAAALVFCAAEGGRSARTVAEVLNRLSAKGRGGQARALWTAAASCAASAETLSDVAEGISDPARADLYRAIATGRSLPEPSQPSGPPAAVQWKDRPRHGGSTGWVIPGDRDGSAPTDILLCSQAGYPVYDALSGKRLSDASFRKEAILLHAGILFLQGDGRLRAFDAASMEPLWEAEIAGAGGHARGNVPAPTDKGISAAGGVVLAVDAGDVLAFEAATGQRLWRLQAAGARAVAAEGRGRLAVVVSYESVQVRDLFSGRAVGEAIPLPPSDLSFLRATGGSVAILGRRGNQTGWVKVIDPATRKEIFSSEEQGAGAWQDANIVAAEGRVGYPAHRGYCLVDAATGKRLFISMAPAGGAFFNLLTARLDGRFLVARWSQQVGRGHGGMTACFDLAKGESVWSAPGPMTAHVVDTPRWVVYDLPPQNPGGAGRPAGLSLAVVDKETGKRVGTVQGPATAVVQQVVAGPRGGVAVVLSTGEIWGLGPAADGAEDPQERSGQ